MNPHEKKIMEAMGEDNSQPAISFYDHAVLNRALTDQSGRPRFIAKTYIQKVPTAPDLIVRDIFSRAMTEEDKLEYPAEWQKYCDRKADIDNLNPPITVLPGMGVAEKYELHALKIYTCTDFVNHPDPLPELAELRETARKILEVSNELRARRQAVRDDQRRQVHADREVFRASPEIRAGTLRTTEVTENSITAQTENYEEKGQQEKGQQKESLQTFTYNFRVA